MIPVDKSRAIRIDRIKYIHPQSISFFSLSPFLQLCLSTLPPSTSLPLPTKKSQTSPSAAATNTTTSIHSTASSNPASMANSTPATTCQFLSRCVSPQTTPIFPLQSSSQPTHPTPASITSTSTLSQSL